MRKLGAVFLSNWKSLNLISSQAGKAPYLIPVWQESSILISSQTGKLNTGFKSDWKTPYWIPVKLEKLNTEFQSDWKTQISFPVWLESSILNSNLTGKLKSHFQSTASSPWVRHLKMSWDVFNSFTWLNTVFYLIVWESMMTSILYYVVNLSSIRRDKTRSFTLAVLFLFFSLQSTFLSSIFHITMTDSNNQGN